MYKLTKIFTLLVLSVALLNQVIAQYSSLIESEEAFDASDRAHSVSFSKYL